jgi:Domain of unknown function (DUF6089)
LQPFIQIFMRKLRIILLLAAILAIPLIGSAQMRGWELGGWAGGSNYFGDLNTSWRVNRTHIAGGVASRYNFNDRIAFRLGVSYARISGYDADSKNAFEQRRNLHFWSNIGDATAQIEFNFLPYIHGHRDYYYTPYIFAGPSFFFFNPKAELEGKTYRLRDYGTEGQFRGDEYKTNQGAIAYGMGFKIDLSYRWSINGELSARRIFTDYLDDVSGVYADIRDIRAQRGAEGAALADRSGEPAIGVEGRQRGNGKKNDAYVMVGIGIHYYFGYIRCPGILK